LDDSAQYIYLISASGERSTAMRRNRAKENSLIVNNVSALNRPDLASFCTKENVLPMRNRCSNQRGEKNN